MMRSLFLLAALAAAAGAVDTVPVRENGMLRGPTEDGVAERRRLWFGWNTLLST